MQSLADPNFPADIAVLAANGRGRRLPVCFASSLATELSMHWQADDPAPFRLNLNSQQSETLAALLPVLLCGEESASIAFARISMSSALSNAGYQHARRIEAEERTHEHWLTQIKLALPTPRKDQQLLRASKRFFCGLAERDLGRHFARIAALDSAVCILMGALRRRHGCVDREPTLRNIFARIHRDEARHVLIAREFTSKLLSPAEAVELTADTRHGLVGLLAMRADALEALLQLDPDRLFTRLRNPARELLA